MKFETERLITGVTEKISQKTGKPYKMVNYLNDDGQSFSTICDCDVPQGVKQLSKVLVTFDVLPGRYLQLKTVGLKLV